MRLLFLVLVLLLVGGSAFAAPSPAREIAAEYLVRVKPMPKRVLVVAAPGNLQAQLTAAGMTVDTLDPANDVAAIFRGEEDSAALPQLGRGAARSRVRYDAVVVDPREIFLSMRGAAMRGVPLSAAPTLLQIERNVDLTSLVHDADAREGEVTLLAAGMADGSWSALQLEAPARPLASADGGSFWPAEDGLSVDPMQNGTEKTVRAFGYLVASPSGLRIELAHDRTEASVVYLTGAVSERQLRPHARAGTLVRDRADGIVSAPAGSMLPVFGPGWSVSGRHAIVAGDVVVAVHGKAAFRGRGALPHDASRSGLSWTLEVDSVERILDRPWWEPHEKAHLAHLAAARGALAAARWTEAAVELDTSAAALATALGPDAPGCNWIDATRDLAKRIRAIDADPHSMACFEDTYRPDRRSLERPVPHPADLSLYAVYKKAKDDRYFGNVVLGPAHRHGSAVPEDRPVMCWWESTAGDPGYPTARHREVAKTYLFYAPEVRAR